MKKLVIALLFPMSCFTQTISDTCFTEEQIINISMTLDSLWEADSINNVLIKQQEDVIKSCRTLIALDSVQIAYQKQQIELLNDNVDLYIKRQRQLQPKWWDAKGIWFGSGLVTAILTAFSISNLIN
jgi:capsular polysaccharide biosynthesis protein